MSIFRLYTTATHLTHNVIVESPEQRQQAVSELHAPSILLSLVVPTFVPK
jgi:hypothetical protein